MTQTGEGAEMSSTEVTNNTENTRFELTIDAAVVGFAQYRQAPKQLRAFLRTEVDSAYQGQGLGGTLIKSALDSTREAGLGVLPYCPAFQGVIAKNPEYLDLVPEDRRSEFNLDAE